MPACFHYAGYCHSRLNSAYQRLLLILFWCSQRPVACSSDPHVPKLNSTVNFRDDFSPAATLHYLLLSVAQLTFPLAGTKMFSQVLFFLLCISEEPFRKTYTELSGCEILHCSHCLLYNKTSHPEKFSFSFIYYRNLSVFQPKNKNQFRKELNLL